MSRSAPSEGASCARGPCRGRIRKRSVALIIGLLLVAWVGWKVYAIMSAKPGPLVDYTKQLTALSEKYQPEGEDGWPALVAALEHFDKIGVPDVDGWPTDSKGNKLAPDIMGICEGPFDAKRDALEVVYLEYVIRTGVLNEVREALSAPRFVRTDPVSLDVGAYFLTAPELSSGVQFGKTRCAAMRVAAATGDWQGVVDAVRDQLRLAAAVSFGPVGASYSASLAIQSHLFLELNQELVEYDFGQSVCEQILGLLERSPKPAPMELSLEAQRLWFQDLVNRTYSDDGHGDGILLVREAERYLVTDAWSSKYGSVDNPFSKVLGLGSAKRLETLKAIDTIFDAAVRQSHMTRTEREGDPFDLADIRGNLLENQWILRHRTPDLARQFSSHLAVKSGMTAMRLLVAIRLYEVRHGALPKSLEDLVPGCVTDIPIDPISDHAYVYRQRQPDQDDPRAYWLYTVGADRTDDGARELEGSDGTPIQTLQSDRFQSGCDYIFNRLREPVEEEQ